MVNRTRGVDLARRARVAETRWARLRGLLGRPRLQAGQGLVLSPSRGVHTWGMGYAIDVVVVDGGGRVTAVYRGLAPWSRTRLHRDGRHAVELPEGAVEATGTRPGDRIDLVPAGGDHGSDPHDPGTSRE